MEIKAIGVAVYDLPVGRLYSARVWPWGALWAVWGDTPTTNAQFRCKLGKGQRRSRRNRMSRHRIG